MTNEQQRRANLKTGWFLAGLAALFALAFVVKMVLWGG